MASVQEFRIGLEKSPEDCSRIVALWVMFLHNHCASLGAPWHREDSPLCPEMIHYELVAEGAEDYVTDRVGVPHFQPTSPWT